MLKRLWLILGPLLIAFVLVVITIFSFPTQLDHSIAQEKQMPLRSQIVLLKMV